MSSKLFEYNSKSGTNLQSGRLNRHGYFGQNARLEVHYTTRKMTRELKMALDNSLTGNILEP